MDDRLVLHGLPELDRPTAAPDCGTLLPSRALRAGAAADGGR